MNATAMAKQEDKWRIESDARTLIEAAEIKLDKARYRKALDHVKKTAAATNAALATPDGAKK